METFSLEDVEVKVIPSNKDSAYFRKDGVWYKNEQS